VFAADDGASWMKTQERPWDLEPSMIALGAAYAACIICAILVVAGFAL
jgi:hypothetical protein